jgi:acetyl esterase/lipase
MIWGGLMPPGTPVVLTFSRAARRAVAAAVLAAALSGAPALAQAPAAQAAPPLISPLPTLAQPDAIALSPAGTAPGGEQWEMFHGERIVRNVTAPTLTPFLPDPAKATGAAVIVAPGGGFLELSMGNEGYPVARWLADHGIAAFLLKYRTRETPRDPQTFLKSMGELMGAARINNVDISQTTPEAIADAQAAVRLVRARAGEWGVDPARVGMVGFSAGAMTTLSLGVAPDKGARPDFIAPIYGPMGPLTVPADAPQAFFAVALDDPLMARGKSLGLIESWRGAGRPLEVHLYQSGGHGFGMSRRTAAAALWIDQFYAWMKDRGLLKPGP